MLCRLLRATSRHSISDSPTGGYAMLAAQSLSILEIVLDSFGFATAQAKNEAGEEPTPL